MHERGRTVEPLMLFIASIQSELPSTIVATWPLLKAMRSRYWLQLNYVNDSAEGLMRGQKEPV